MLWLAHGWHEYGEVRIVTLKNRIPDPWGRTLGVVPAVLLVLAWTGVAHGRASPESFADLVETLLPTVVNISTSQTVKGPEGAPLPRVPKGAPFELTRE